ncbi:hypothetical protein BDB00DRAFT_833697 [Zychaea mexicana]|uniref:uncharacterized protein n=1 Tax=Zychaea mexicana TaxID=64656 RepID=UPI0022FDBFA3|nr:uncharacterized protein BDB00DRAFT_833697 [Zychaea mexicana]KAI9491260.1 hypothetical protein BDB00DRAFT_833697 [Zychaea mexicana]
MQTSEYSSSDRPILPPISSIDSQLPSSSSTSSSSSSWSFGGPGGGGPSMSLPSPPLGNHKSAPAATISSQTAFDQSRRLSPLNFQSHTQAQAQHQYPHTLHSQPLPHSPPQHHQQPSPQKLAPWPQPDYRASQHQQIETQRAAATRKRVFQDMDQVVNNCTTMRETMLRQQSNMPVDAHLLANSQPWLDDMIGHANEILNALLRMQKQQLAAQEEKRQAYYSTLVTPTSVYVDQRPEMHDDDEAMHYDDSNPLRSLRQRKRRKRNVFQGRCHSCNISETPEWRRGPDGARTLCNACGLHYAKLERKRAAAEANKEKDPTASTNKDDQQQLLVSPSSSPTTTASSSMQDDAVVTP